MIIDFEPVLNALLAHFQANCTLNFTATATAGSTILSDVSGFTGLFVGLPVFGDGVVDGATIAAIDQSSKTLTLSDAVTATAPGLALGAGFQTVSRRIQSWSEVSAQPALFLRRIGTTDEYAGDSCFSITTLETEAWIYCKAGQNPDLAPDTGLTTLEKLVRQSMAPDTDYGDPRFTLNGLVYWCRVEGRGDANPSDLAGQALSLMPIRITLP
jgi:hypothetical protein